MLGFDLYSLTNNNTNILLEFKSIKLPKIERFNNYNGKILNYLILKYY